MLTAYESAQLATAADSIIRDIERDADVSVERMFQLLDNFRDRLSSPPCFDYRGYNFELAFGDDGAEGVAVTMPGSQAT